MNQAQKFVNSPTFDGRKNSVMHFEDESYARHNGVSWEVGEGRQYFDGTQWRMRDNGASNSSDLVSAP